jgi:flagella basal body P-ring formation protein FlgA
MSRKKLLPILPLMLCSLAAYAQGQDFESPERIRAAARDFVQQQTGAGVQIQVSALDARLRLPACEQAPQAFMPPGIAARGALTVGVRCDAPVAWTLYVPVRISDLRKVLVLTRSLGRGQAITADALELQERDAASLPYGFVTDPAQVLGQTLRRPLAPGSVLAPDALETARIIHRGQSVTLIGQAGGIEVRMRGTAMADGGAGDRLQVQNTSSKRTVEGVVRSADTVEVSF